MTRIILLVDPRFSGGTSSAVAREIAALAPVCTLQVQGLETCMFKGRTPNPRITEAVEEAGVPFSWAQGVVRSEAVVLHNPSCLRFNKTLGARILCDRLYVVCHENFVLPTGSEAFDVAGALDMIEASTLARRLVLCPISGLNRRTVEAWLSANPRPRWEVAGFDWFNICDFEMTAPVAVPADRRGRVSRPGFEKFPKVEDLRAAFPPHAERNALLGADALLREGADFGPNTTLLPFGAEEVERFLEGIDFFVYHTSPGWTESFGRVIAEAIAAGKVVITDPAIATSFPGMVVPAAAGDVDGVIGSFLSGERPYAEFVRQAQIRLAGFSVEAFRATVFENVQHGGKPAWT